MKPAKILTLLLLALSIGIAAWAQTADEPAPQLDNPEAITPDEPPPPPPEDVPDEPEREPEGPDVAPVAPAVNPIAPFYRELAPYGEWIDRPGYGQIWVPNVAPGWRPYTTGRWAYTDEGWTWVAEEPWGWAPFHYGRWLYDAEAGWAWMPGRVWAPAWVAWRSGGGYIGWAPLPPAIGFSAGVGLELGGVAISPTHYTFVSERSILAPRVAVLLVSPARNRTIIARTTNFTRYTIVNQHVVNHGVDVQHVERVTGRPVPRLRVAAVSSGPTAGRGSAPGQVVFYRPPVLSAAANSGRAEFGRSLYHQGEPQASRRTDRVGADRPRNTDSTDRSARRRARDPQSADPARTRNKSADDRQHRERTHPQGSTQTSTPHPPQHHRTPPPPKPQPKAQPKAKGEQHHGDHGDHHSSGSR